MRNILALTELTFKEIYRKKDFYIAFILIIAVMVYTSSLKFHTIDNASRYIRELGLALIFFLAMYSQKGSHFFREFLRKVKMTIPVVGRITKNQELAYFSNSMGMLLKSGVPALKALETTIPGVQDPKLKLELKEVLGKVSGGQSLYESFNNVTSLPGFFIRMVAVGEDSGRLTDVFEELSRSYTEQVESDISVLSALLEPVLILFLGLVMGAIVISILVPMFQITQLVE